MSHLNRKRSPAIDEFFSAILSLHSVDECYLFFSDLCTVQELTSMVQRLQAAGLLADGNTYKTVQEQIGISSSTITRINTELCYGAGGYRLILNRMHEQHQQQAFKEASRLLPEQASAKVELAELALEDPEAAEVTTTRSLHAVPAKAKTG